MSNTITKEFTRKVTLLKADDEQRNVFGIFSMTKIGDNHLVDLQDDCFTTEELEKAAYSFVLKVNTEGHGGLGNSHKTVNVGKLIESMVITKEKCEMLEEVLKGMGIDAVMSPGADIWVGGFHVEDDATWAMIKSGEFEGFSIGGRAVVTEIK